MASASSVLHEASAVLDQLLSEVKAKFASSQQQQGVFEAIRAFTAAVDWRVCMTLPCLLSSTLSCAAHSDLASQEPWLLTVLASQLVLFLSILFFRKNNSYLAGVFLLASKGSLVSSDSR